jgi:hypothetical protein
MEEIILFLSVIFYKEIAQMGHSLTTFTIVMAKTAIVSH